MIDKSSRTPLYIQIYEKVLEDIRGKVYREGDILPSEKEFSERFNVERQTIRRALELLVNEGLVEKKQGIGSFVRKYRQRIGEDGAVMPRDANAAEARKYAFLLPGARNGIDRITEPFNSQFFTALGAECREGGCLLTYSVPETADDISRIVERVDGMILVSAHPECIYARIKELMIPAVSINEEPGNMVSVVEDSMAGVYDAARYLIERGHRTIGFINGPEGYSTSVQRQMGWIKAMDEAGVNYGDLPMERGDWSFNGGMDAMNRILDRGETPAALIAANDMMAYGAIESAKAAGIAVPEELSVIGFDNIDQCTYMKPHLTSVSPDIRLMANLAFMHITLAERNGGGDVYKVVVPATLVERDSVIPVRPR